MKKILLCMVAVAALAGIVLQAQSLQKMTGTWQGALKNPNGQLRLVIKISLENDKLKAVLYSIDQRSPAIPASTVTSDGTSVKMSIAALNGTYEAKLSPDGNTLSGTWSQGGPGQPLDCARATSETAWAIPEPPPPPARMAANAKPGIEVSTVKPSDPNRPGKLFTVRGADVVTINTTVSDLITMAYNLHPKQITGAPGWIESEKFDLTIRPDVPGQPNVDQLKILMQKVLADRFQLKFHNEKKELAAYALTAGKGGPKFSKSERDPDSLPGLFFQGRPPGITLNVTNATMQEVCNLLQSSVLDKPVVDQTGLKEKYDFSVKFTPEAGQMAGLGGGPQPAAPPDVDAPPDLFTAVQQQLGLKLDSTKTPVDVLAVDRVEKPSEN